MPPENPRYLVEDRVREHRAMRMLFADGRGERLFAWLGLNEACWFVLRLQMRRLDPSFEGDIDLLGGKLELAEGSIKWPPSIDYLVAVEAKCARASHLNNPEDPEKSVTLKSTKESPRKEKQMRRSIDQLSEMGFDRVALLDLIANSPAGGWFNALAHAWRSTEAMDPALRRHKPSECFVGHIVLSKGAVEGVLEDMGGAISLRMRRAALENPRLNTPEGLARRNEIESNLLKVLADLPPPKYLFAIFDDCPKCGRVHPQPFCDLC
jgi:hypothetical protein